MRYPPCCIGYHLVAGWYWEGIAPTDCPSLSAGRRCDYCLGLTPSQARYRLSQRDTHSASLLGDHSSASRLREPVERLRMLSASSGKDQSKKSPATTVATAQPKQVAGASSGERDTRRGILRPVGQRWSQKARQQRHGEEKGREAGRERQREGRRAPSDHPPAPRKRGGGESRRREEGASASRQHAPPRGAKRPRRQLQYEGPEESGLASRPSPCPLSEPGHPGSAS